MIPVSSFHLLFERNQTLGSSQNANPVCFHDNRRNAYHIPHQPTCSGAAIPAGQMPSPLTQCVWTFFWLAVLLFIALPIGVFSCQVYVVLSPISAFISCFSKLTDFLLRLAHMPLGCTHNMISAKPLLFI